MDTCGVWRATVSNSPCGGVQTKEHAKEQVARLLGRSKPILSRVARVSRRSCVGSYCSYVGGLRDVAAWGGCVGWLRGVVAWGGCVSLACRAAAWRSCVG